MNYINTKESILFKFLCNMECEVWMDIKDETIFSVIIVTYNNLDIIKECLISIYKYNDIGQSLEVIVVDNSPNNDIVNYIKINFTDVIIIKNENNGFGEGNNIGFRCSKGKYILLLNPDTILVEPIFRYAISKFDSDNELGLFGVKLIDSFGKINQSFNYIDHYDIIHAQIVKIYHRISYFDTGKMYIQGADMFIRRVAFSEAGLFDSRMFMYYEEPDLIKRIKEKKYKIAYFNDKKIIHLEGKSSGASVDMLKIKLDSQKIYCEKYGIDFNREIRNEIRRMKVKSYVFYFINRNIYTEYTGKIKKISNILSVMEY